MAIDSNGPFIRPCLSRWFITKLIFRKLLSCIAWNHIWLARRRPFGKCIDFRWDRWWSMTGFSRFLWWPSFTFMYMGYAAYYPSAKQSSAVDLAKITAITKRSMRALWTLRRPVDQWSDWVLFHTVRKLDKKTRVEWQCLRKERKKIRTLDELLEFLNRRIQALRILFSSS